MDLQKRTVLSAARNNFYIFAVLAYAGVLLYNYIRAGVVFQFSLGLYALVTIPIVLLILHKTQSSQQQLFLKQWIPFVIILLSYEALQGTAGVSINLNNIINLYPIDRALWSMNVTGYVQSIFLSQWMTNICLFFYTLHFYLIIIASVTFWFFRRSLFAKYAIAMIITSYVSLTIFALFPTAPPWFSGAAINIETSKQALQGVPTILQQFSHFDLVIESDKYAAFPSLHAAYATLFAAYMIKFRRKLAAVVIPLEFGVLFATLYLGQHYVIDLIAGISLALASVYLADIVARKFSHSLVATPETESKETSESILYRAKRGVRGKEEEEEQQKEVPGQETS